MSNDLKLYSTYAHEWWQAGSPRFRSLQNITPFRISIIEELCGSVAGKTVYDLGCGGGLISIPLIDRGAHLTGMDISEPSIEAAEAAAHGRGRFFVGDVTCVPLPDHSADIVLLADVIDHVPNYSRAIAEAARLVKSNGRVFIGTINRTIQSWIGAILLGEGLRLIPPGTHRHSMFVKPKELIDECSKVGLKLLSLQGEGVVLRETLRRWAITLERSNDCSLAYSTVFAPINI